MSRFTWNSASNGRVINKYIDTMCRDFPSIMRSVAKKGIKGRLTDWFERSGSAGKATCGCLVGTTCVIAIDKYNHLSDEQKDSHDAAMILYELIVRKTKRDVSKYTVPEHSGEIDYNGSGGYDPLLVLIYKAGMAAADEAVLEYSYNILDDDMRDLAEEARHKQVVDHIEHRIRTKLNIPYLKRKGK